jgi:NAD(P)-dependent dehydrogenase (short-subunit alcohol dehydrogenase family)
LSQDATTAAFDPLAAFRLDGRVAVVTGASSGLGARFARVLHAAGASVVVAARRAERLEALAGELPGLVAVPTDVASAPAREALVAATLERFGTVDVLVNCAGVALPLPIEDETLEDFARGLEVNLVASWHLAKLVGVPMVAQGRGSVVNVASISGLVSSAPVKQASYAASKGGVVNLTRELAVQWARKGVRVNAIAPGWFASEMSAPMESESGQRFITAGTPMARMGAPAELDGALLLLASDAGSYITGHVLTVDGGWTAK